MIKTSAIICTYKRSNYLRTALYSLLEQSLPRDQYEVIVVDNAVEIETERVVAEFKSEAFSLRYVPEPAVGLSRARNAGLKSALGKYVAFIDDDARAHPDWLRTLTNAFEQASPSPSAIGGRVWLDWQGERPDWVPDRHLSLFTHVDYGDVGHQLHAGEYLVGANLAFNREDLLSLGGFDPTLGRQGKVLLSGEETAIVEQLQDLGRVVYYEPAAVVWHSVDPSRRRPSWLLRRLFWDGASQPLLDTPASERSRRSTSLNAYHSFRQCGRWLFEVLVAVLKGKKQSAWESLLGLSQRCGRLRTEMRLLARNAD